MERRGGEQRSWEVCPKRAVEILSYFLRNPEAVDSLEGVARWRLPQELMRQQVEEIDDALRWLSAKGFLLVRPVRGSYPLFSLHRERTTDAMKFIARADSGHSRRRSRSTRTGDG